MFPEAALRRDGLLPETRAQASERIRHGKQTLAHNTKILAGWKREQLIALFCECGARFMQDKFPETEKLRTLAPSLIKGRLREVGDLTI